MTRPQDQGLAAMRRRLERAALLRRLAAEQRRKALGLAEADREALQRRAWL